MTRHEFGVALAVVLLIVALAVPGVVRRTRAANEAAAEAAVAMMAHRQQAFAAACGRGRYAAAIEWLAGAAGVPPAAAEERGYQEVRGYRIVLMPRDVVSDAVDCRGRATAASFEVRAEPTWHPFTGRRVFRAGPGGVVHAAAAAR